MRPVASRATTCCVLFGVSLFLMAGCREGAKSSSASKAESEIPRPGTSLSQAQHSDLQTRMQARCLVDKGWDVQLDENNVINYEVSQAQESKLLGDMKSCTSDFLKSYPRPTVDVEGWRRMYAHNVWLMGCLTKEGYPPLVEAPSEAEYLDQARRNGAPEWYAYGAVKNPKDINQLYEQCPQEPAGW